MKIEIANNEVVQINNKQEFEEIYENLRYSNEISCEDWFKDYGVPNFPLWLEGINSVTRGYSIGYRTKEPENVTILRLKDFK